MAVVRVLRMVFSTAGGRRAAVQVRDPRENLTAMEVEAAMNTIVGRNIFSTSSGDLTGIVSASIVERQTTPIIGG